MAEAKGTSRKKQSAKPELDNVKAEITSGRYAPWWSSKTLRRRAEDTLGSRASEAKR